MCRREIGFYQRRNGADSIKWIDVSNPENAPDDMSCAQAMARFHVRTESGVLVDGGAAFAQLWKQLPAFRWLGLIFDTPATRWILNTAYNLFLPLRPRLQGLFRDRTSPQDQRLGNP